MNAGILFKSLNCIKYYLTSSQKREGIAMLFLSIFSSLLDVIGLAALVPLIIAASETGYIQKNKYFSFLFSSLGFTSESAFLIFAVLVIFCFFLLKNLFSTWINYRQVKFSAAIANTIIHRQYTKFTGLPFWLFNNMGHINIMYYIIDIPSQFISGIFRGLFVIFSEFVILIIIIAGILLFKPTLLILLVVILGPTTILTYNALKKRGTKIGQRANAIRPVATSITADSLLGHVEIKLAEKEEEFKNIISGYIKELQTLEAKGYLLSLIPIKIIEMVTILGVVTIFIYSLIFVDNPKELLAILGLFTAAAYRLMPSVNRLMVGMVELKKNQYTIDLLKEFDEYDEHVTGPTPQKALQFKSEIKLDQVSFSFPGKDIPVLKEVSLEIKKGEKVGFIGSSGAGKTTLMNLLLRFYTENNGGIYVDGVKLSNKNLRAWRRMIGYVKQDAFLMNASIKDNITLFDKAVDEQRLADALEKASLQEFVAALPNGIETPIGDRGSKLSGGQRQRIGIARALYKKTEILIFDEATSALDNTTEKEVNEAIKNLSDTNITILIIAHRYTSLKECNRIFELKNGEIISQRSYSELIKEAI
ncbi:MAG: ABC transporter ATP-binding protein [Adhaeribacter sp.]